MLAHDDLPDDVPALKALLGERESELMTRTSDLALAQGELAALKLEYEKLQALVAVLNRHRFGRRSETLSADQLALGLQDNAQSLGPEPGRARRGDHAQDAAPRAPSTAGAQSRRAARGTCQWLCATRRHEFTE